MALTGSGRGLSYQTNTATGKLTLVWGTDGNPQFDDTENETVLSLLMERPGWVADTTGRRKSKLTAIKFSDTNTASLIVSYATEALQVAVLDHRIRGGADLVVTATQIAVGSYVLHVNYKTVRGKPGHVDLPIQV